MSFCCTYRHCVSIKGQHSMGEERKGEGYFDNRPTAFGQDCMLNLLINILPQKSSLFCAFSHKCTNLSTDTTSVKGFSAWQIVQTTAIRVWAAPRDANILRQDKKLRNIFTIITESLTDDLQNCCTKYDDPFRHGCEVLPQSNEIIK